MNAEQPTTEMYKDADAWLGQMSQAQLRGMMTSKPKVPGIFVEAGKTEMVRKMLNKLDEDSRHRERPVYYQRDEDTLVWLTLLALRMSVFEQEEFAKMTWPHPRSPEFAAAWAADPFVQYVDATLPLCMQEIRRVHHAVHGIHSHMEMDEPFRGYRMEVNRVAQLFVRVLSGIMSAHEREGEVMVGCVSAPAYMESFGNEASTYKDLTLPEFWRAYRASLAQQYAAVCIYNASMQHKNAILRQHPMGLNSASHTHHAMETPLVGAFDSRIWACFQPFFGVSSDPASYAPAVHMTEHGQHLDLVVKSAVRDVLTATKGNPGADIGAIARDAVRRHIATPPLQETKK